MTVRLMVERVYSERVAGTQERRRGPHRVWGAAVPRQSLGALLMPWRLRRPPGVTLEPQYERGGGLSMDFRLY